MPTNKPDISDDYHSVKSLMKEIEANQMNSSTKEIFTDNISRKSSSSKLEKQPQENGEKPENGLSVINNSRSRKSSREEDGVSNKSSNKSRRSSSTDECDCCDCVKQLCDPCCGDNVRALADCGICLGKSAVEVGHCLKHTHCSKYVKSIFTLDTLKSKVPILQWIPKYRLKHLQGDLIAGIAVGLTVLPQGLAYAKIAQLPPQYGLYTSFMCCYVYGIMGTSKDLSVGVAAVASVLTGSFALSPIDGDATYAIVLALLCGCVQILMSIFHIGFIIDYVSHPVMHAFIQSSVLTIIVGQIDNWLALTDIPREFLPQVAAILTKLPETRLWDFLLGLGCMAVLLSMKKMKLYRCGASRNSSKAMNAFLYFIWLLSTARNAVVVVGATGLAAILCVNETEPFKLTGDIPPGLPAFKLPSFSVSDGNTTYTASDIFEKLGTGIVVVPIMGILEAVAIAKSFARKNKYKVDTNQELLAIGISNVLGSFVSAYPVTGSFARSAINGQSGVKTPAGQFVTGTMVVLVLAFATPVFYYIPDSALAAIIIMAVSDMFDYTPLIEMWEIKKIDLVAWFATYLLGLIFGIETGIIVGIFVSVCILLYPSARPGMQIDQKDDYTVVMVNQGLVYPSVEYFKDHVMEKALGDEETASSTRAAVILDLTHVTSLDSSTGQCIKNLAEDFASIKAILVFCNIKKNVKDILDDCQIKIFNHATTLDEAIALVRRIRESMTGVDSEDELGRMSQRRVDENAEVATLLISEYNDMRSSGYIKDGSDTMSCAQPDDDVIIKEENVDAVNDSTCYHL